MAGWTKVSDSRDNAPGPVWDKRLVEVRDGLISLENPAGSVGIVSVLPVPKHDYELSYQAMRVRDYHGPTPTSHGNFCYTTFPVGLQATSMRVGGDEHGPCVSLPWLDGGGDDNETRRPMTFETGRWYAIRLRVADDRIRAWIDEKSVVDLATRGRELDGSAESLPLGLASDAGKAALRAIRLRQRKPAAGSPHPGLLPEQHYASASIDSQIVLPHREQSTQVTTIRRRWGAERHAFLT